MSVAKAWGSQRTEEEPEIWHALPCWARGSLAVPHVGERASERLPLVLVARPEIAWHRQEGT